MVNNPFRSSNTGRRQQRPNTQLQNLIDQENQNNIKGQKPAQPERVDPVTEPNDSVRSVVASNSEVAGFDPNTENISDRIARQNNFVGGPENRQLANVEDAPIAQQIDAARTTRERNQTPPPTRTQIAGSSSEFLFQSNILSNYENPTYHFRLSVTNPEFLKTMQDVSSLPRVLLAESANSKYFIEDVTIDSYVNFDQKHRNQGVFSVEMTILEPTGSSFLDHVYNASVQIGADNWMMLPYILELWFLGRNPTTGEEEVIQNSVWSYVLYVATPRVNVDEGGTKYNFTFRGFENRSFVEDMNKTDSEFVIKAKKIGEFLDKLSQKLNDAEKSKRQSGPLAINEYTWKIKEPIKNDLVTRPVSEWSIVPKNFNENSQRGVSVTEKEAGKPTITIPRNTDLGKLIENIVGTTEEGAKLATGFNDLLNIQGQEPAHEWKFIPAVEAKLDYGQFVGEAADYNKEITYTLFFRRTTPISISVKETKKVNDAGKQKKRLLELNKTGLLSKRYDYIYTGRNTEVLNFDLEFNTLWRAPALYYGSVYHYEAATTGPKVNEQKLSYIKGITKKKQLLNEYSQANQRALDPNKGGPPQDRAALKTFYEDVKGDVEKVSGGAVTVSPEEWESVFNRQSRQELREARERESARRFKQQSQRLDSNIIRLEDLPNDFQQGQKRIQLALDQYDSNPRMDVAHMTESDWKPNKSLFSLAMHQAYGMTSGDLVRMEIEIRGDPYWLGRGNSQYYSTGSVVTDNNLQIYGGNGNVRPDFNEGNQMLLLNFGYPRNPNEGGEINRDRFASAVYIAWRVTNKFQGGEFTQTLGTIRDQLTNPDAIGPDIFKIRSQ